MPSACRRSCLALLDVRLQHQLGLIGPSLDDRAQHLGVLHVGRLDAVGAGEVEPANDADALGHFPVHARDLGIAGGAHHRRMELLVVRAHGATVGQPLGRRHEPRP